MVKIKNSKLFGFTLIELLVTVVIFSLVVGAATAVFVQTLKAQRRSLANQELLDQTSYLMEYMSRALRMAKKDVFGSCISQNLNYEIVGQGIKFLNYKEECQKFYLDENQLKEEKKNEIFELTSPHLRVLKFKLELLDQDSFLQPRVIFLLEIEGKEKAKVLLQTTVSQRNLNVEK